MAIIFSHGCFVMCSLFFHMHKSKTFMLNLVSTLSYAFQFWGVYYKIHLTDLFDKTKFKNDKERCDSSGLSLFNF